MLCPYCAERARLGLLPIHDPCYITVSGTNTNEQGAFETLPWKGQADDFHRWERELEGCVCDTAGSDFCTVDGHWV